MIAIHKKVTRRTVGVLDGTYGPDSGRSLVVSLDAADLIRLRPFGTRHEETISLFDVYHYAIRCRVNHEILERARARKVQRQAQRETRRLDAAERRLRNKLKDEAANEK